MAILTFEAVRYLGCMERAARGLQGTGSQLDKLCRMNFLPGCNGLACRPLGAYQQMDRKNQQDKSDRMFRLQRSMCHLGKGWETGKGWGSRSQGHMTGM